MCTVLFLGYCIVAIYIIYIVLLLGFTLYGLSAANLMDSTLNIPSALLFGTICAAVDPVAVSVIM